MQNVIKNGASFGGDRWLIAPLASLASARRLERVCVRVSRRVVAGEFDCGRRVFVAEALAVALAIGGGQGGNNGRQVG